MVKATDPNFERVRSYTLSLRLGSASYTEFERGPVVFAANPAITGDGDPVVSCECSTLGEGRFTAREFVQRAYARGREHFELEAQTRRGEHPKQGDMALTLLDGRDRTVVKVSSKLKRAEPGSGLTETFDYDDSPAMAGEVRESSRTLGDVTRSLGNTVANMHTVNKRAETDESRMITTKFEAVCEGFTDVIDARKDVTTDLVVAADSRARAEKDLEALKIARENDLGWFEKFIGTDSGQDTVKALAPVVAPALATLVTAVVSAATSGLEVLTLKAKAKTAQAKADFTQQQARLEAEAKQRAALVAPEPEPEPS